jgi:non-ribosomal peptide synthetase component F
MLGKIDLYLGKPFPLPHLHYKDFSQWQNRWLEEEEGKRQEAYWLEQFRERPPLLNLPLDHPRPLAPSYEADSFDFEVDSQLTLKIRQLTAETQTTLFMVLLAVYYILWFKYTMQEDIVVGTPFSGRNYADTQGMIGMFAGIIPLRNRPQKEKSFIKFLEDVKNNVLDVFENQDYQYENLLRKLGLHGNSRALFNVAFTVSEDVQGIDKESSDLKDTGNLKLSIYPYRKLTAKYDLSILGFGYGEVIRLSMQYDRELFKLETIERISAYYLEILKDVVENRDKKLVDIKMPHQLLLVESRTLLKELDEFEF